MKLRDLTPEFEEWLAGRPQIIRDMAAKLPPNHLYRLKTAGQRVVLYSFSENGTVTVHVSKDYNPLRVHVGHNVFGIKPEDLEMLPESEREVIAAEQKQMEPHAGVRDAMIEEHWSPEGIERTRARIAKLCKQN